MTRMRNLLLLMLLVCPALAACQTLADTLVVVVRHAEKSADDPRDPSLSDAGAARAQSLAGALRHVPLDAVFVSPFRRTQLTASPAAVQSSLQAIELPASSAVAADAEALATRILTDFRGKSVLIVGHSNTVPEIVAALSGLPPMPMGDDEYDRFTTILISASGARRVRVTRY